MKRKKYEDMSPEEEYKENLRRAKRDSRQAIIFAVAAIVINIINIIRAFLKAIP